MLVHTVFFWLKKDLTPAQRENFEKGVTVLTTIKPHVAMYLGKPAKTELRPVIDATYDYSLTCVFENIADQDKYQAEPLHLKFIDDHKADWQRVVVYDAE